MTQGIKPAETSQYSEFIVQSNRDKGISTNTIAEETGLSSKELLIVIWQSHGVTGGNKVSADGN